MTTRSDSQWLRQSFLLPKRTISARDFRRRTYATGWNKFSDTTLGGNQAINPLPQFCRYTDVKEQRKFDGGSGGMGRFYSEVFDDNQVTLTMRLGIPTFNSLTRFFGNFYNSDAATLARTGRGNGLAYSIGRIAGTVAQIRLMPVILVMQAINYLIDRPSTKFYYLKTDMGNYWNSVSGIVNTIAANMGFVANMGPWDAPKGDAMLDALGDGWGNLLPDIYNSNGSVNIYAVGTRYQRLADRRFSAISQALENAGSPAEFGSAVEGILNDSTMYKTPELQFKNVEQYLDAHFASISGKLDVPKTDVVPAQPTTSTGEVVAPQQLPDESVDNLYGPSGAVDPSFSDLLLAEMRDGAQFISFRVDNPGTIGESFSNSVKESGISSAINGMSNSARDFRFNFANGNLAGGVVGAFVGSAVDTVTGIFQGLADSFGAGGLAALMGNALVDIPKYWDSSTSNLPRANFTIELRSPYGNDLARFQNLMVPLAMLLAAALPRSTGYQSYTSPYLCEFYCKGRVQSRLAIIDSLEITRGTGNCGYTADGRPLGIDVNISFIDLSSVMHMPQNAAFNPLGALLGPTEFISKHLFSDDNTFSDYLAVLSSLGIADQTYTPRKLRRRFNTAVLNFKSWTSQEHFASWISNGGVLFGIRAGRITSAFFQAAETTRE